MSKKESSVLNDVAEGLVLVVLGLLALAVTPLVMLFFVPVVGYYIWRIEAKNKALERRIAQLEMPAGEPGPDKPGS